MATLRQLTPPLHSTVLMVTDYDEANLIFESFRTGASGYLLKEDAYGKKLEATKGHKGVTH